LKKAPGFKEYSILLFALLACGVFFAGCSGDSGGTASPTPPSSHAQTAAITPVGALATCLTVNSPSLERLAGGNYKLVDEIDNCGGKDAGPLTITTQVDTETTKQSTNLMGPATIPAHEKAMYDTPTGQTGGSSKELHFPSPPPPSAIVTVLVTIDGAVAGEWDGELKIPA
jgi:hypothetical protein